MSITYTVEKKRESSYNSLLIKVPWKHGNTLLLGISSFYLYALFRNFRTPLDSEPATPLDLNHVITACLFCHWFMFVVFLIFLLILFQYGVY